jgi:hypothetical protein
MKMRQRSGFLLQQLAEDFEFQLVSQYGVETVQILWAQILLWTGGQPFLTYRLCQLLGQAQSQGQNQGRNQSHNWEGGARCQLRLF